MKIFEDRTWKTVFDNKPWSAPVFLLLMVGMLIGIPIAIAAVFNVSVWVPVATIIASWISNFALQVWRNYLYLSIVVERAELLRNMTKKAQR